VEAAADGSNAQDQQMLDASWWDIHCRKLSTRVWLLHNSFAEITGGSGRASAQLPTQRNPTRFTVNIMMNTIPATAVPVLVLSCVSNTM
jgi:hypothetical protein